MKKNKSNWGGVRVGAGRGAKWVHGKTKSVRLPVALLDKILDIAHYMDRNDGKLPPNTLAEVLPPTFSNPMFRSITSEEFEADANWRKAYLKKLSASKSPQQTRPLPP